MKLRTRTMMTFLITTILLVALLHEISYSILTTSYAHLETKEVGGTVSQIQGQMLNRYSTLSSKLTDWSSWDDAYQFVQNNNSAFIASNLAAPSLRSFGVNFLLFVNVTGGLVYGMGVNLTSATKMPVPADVMSLLSTDPEIWRFPNIDSNFTGLAATQEGPLLLASQPILTSDGTGPAMGSLIFGQYFDSQFLQSFSSSLHLPMNIYSYDDWQKSNPGSTIVAPSSYVRPLNSDSIAGYYVLYDIHNNPAYVLGTVQPRTTYQAGLTTIGYIDITVIIAAGVFAIAMVLSLERTVLSRLQKLASELVTIGASGDLSAKVIPTGNDEITSLSNSVNSLLREIEGTNLQLRKTERFSAIGELATMVAHDLRNPLQGISNAAYYLQKTSNGSSAGPKQMEMLALIQQDVKYSDKIVSDLLDYSREVRLELEMTSPRLLVEQTLSMIKVPENVQVVDGAADEPSIEVDVDKIKRTFANIVTNALDAMDKGGRLEILSKVAGDRVEFSFADTGSGITPEVMKNIFTPLFTSKAKGMGFGLSICKRIVEAHSGSIRVDSTPGQGTTFIISLPIRSPYAEKGLS